MLANQPAVIKPHLEAALQQELQPNVVREITSPSPLENAALENDLLEKPGVCLKTNRLSVKFTPTRGGYYPILTDNTLGEFRPYHQ